MTIKSLKYFPYSLQYKVPLKTSRGKISFREGIIIQIIDQNYQQFYGDASPFEEFGSENFEYVLENAKILQQFVEDNIDLDSKTILQFTSHKFSFGCLNYAVEQTFHQFDHKFTNFKESRILVNALVGMIPINQIREKIAGIIDSGYRTVKIKIGRDNFKDDLIFLKEVENVSQNRLKIRLDVNGKWTMEEAEKNLNELIKFNIEYVEQPVINRGDLIELSEKSSIPIAADESIRSVNDAKFLMENSPIKYFVLKPSLMGSFSEMIELINIIEKAGRNVIISSVFESVIGKSGLVYLASLTRKGSTHGLDTTSYLSQNISLDPYPVENGKIHFDKYPPKFGALFVG